MCRTLRILAVTAMLAAAAAIRTAAASGDGEWEFMGMAQNIPVKHEIKGDRFSGDFRSIFMLTAESWDCPMPDDADGMTKTVTVQGGGDPDFGSILFCDPGAYYYRITRTGDAPDGVEASYETYRFMVALLSDGTSEMIIWDEAGFKTDRMVYTDYYHDPHGESGGTTSDETAGGTGRSGGGASTWKGTAARTTRPGSGKDGGRTTASGAPKTGDELVIEIVVGLGSLMAAAASALLYALRARRRMRYDRR